MRLSWIQRAEWQRTFLLAMLTLLLFSKTSGFSPDQVKVLANSGSSSEDSGHPLGPSLGDHQQFPRPLPGRQQLLTSPSGWVTWGQSSCSSPVLLSVPRLAGSER